MSVTPTKLLEKDSGQYVAAELHSSLEFADLLDAEAAWTPARYGVIKRLHAAGVPRAKWPQHWHWNWVHKLVGKGTLDIGEPLSPLRLMGIKAVAEWQGLILATSIGHTTRVGKEGRDLLYIEYLETAPWNLAVRQLGVTQRFAGCGRQLMELAVRLSKSMQLKGRVGLHALVQADGFYLQCGMTDLGPDSSYHNLRYFEMNETQATAFLKPGGTKK